MARATTIIVGPDGKQYVADSTSVRRVMVGEARRVSCYYDDRPSTKGRPDAKFRAGQLHGLDELGPLALLEQQREESDHA